MASNPNNDELEELRNEITARRLMELTLSPGVTWSSVGPLSFKTELLQGTDLYTFYLTAVQNTSRDYSHALDIMKNESPFLSVKESTSTLGNRSNYIKPLYNQVERQVFETNKNIKEVNRLLENTTMARS